MVTLTCRNHSHLRWNTKDIAVNRDGSYNGARNIFYIGTFHADQTEYLDRYQVIEPECPCSPKDLTFAPENVN